MASYNPKLVRQEADYLKHKADELRKSLADIEREIEGKLKRADKEEEQMAIEEKERRQAEQLAAMQQAEEQRRQLEQMSQAA